jgi:hypothetical protein
MGPAFEFLVYLLYGIGAILSWLAKGCKTKLEDEISDDHKIRNASIAICLFIILIAIFVYVNNSLEA